MTGPKILTAATVLPFVITLFVLLKLRISGSVVWFQPLISGSNWEGQLMGVLGLYVTLLLVPAYLIMSRRASFNQVLWKRYFGYAVSLLIIGSVMSIGFAFDMFLIVPLNFIVFFASLIVLRLRAKKSSETYRHALNWAILVSAIALFLVINFITSFLRSFTHF